MTSSASRLSLLLLCAASAVRASTFEPPGQDVRDLLRDLRAVPSASVPPTPIGFGETEHAAYRRLAEGLEATGLDFPDIFRAACAAAVARGGGAQEAKVMLAGLATWLGDRRQPRAVALQGRLDWAFHFVYGAWLESIAEGLGERSALAKEERDAANPDNAYDLDDLAMTLVGARWTRQEIARLSEWGDGRRRLDSLPRLELGRLAPGAFADERQVEEARAFARAALP